MDNEDLFHSLMDSTLEEGQEFLYTLRDILNNYTMSFALNYSITPGLSLSPEINIHLLSDTLQKYYNNYGGLSEEFYETDRLLLLLFQLGNWAHYFATFITTLIGIWALNKHTLKIELITDILETCISLLIILPTMPAVFIFFIILLSIRAMIMLYMKFKYPDGRLSLLNPVDGFWAYETFASTSTCLGLYIIEGTCNVDRIRQNMSQTLTSELVGGKMNRKLTSFFGFSTWETIPKEEMDMEQYVKVVQTKTCSLFGEEQVFQVMREIQDKPIENFRAPWEIYVVPNFTYQTKEGEDKSQEDACKMYAVIYRIHHSIMDGISTANILHSVMADKPFKFTLDPTHPPDKKSSSPLQTGILFLLGLISMPRAALRNLFLVDNYQNKYYLPGPQLTGPKTLSWSKPIRMEALKEIKNKTETSVYCVLLSCLGGAFREYYDKLGVHLDVENFHVMSPIALLPYPDRRPRNRFTGVIVPTNVGDKNKFLSKCERLRKNYQNLKDLGFSSATFLAVANWYYPAVLGLLPLFMHKPLSLWMHLVGCLSNVPGPAEDVYIYGGGKIKDIGIWLPIKYSMGFGMGLFSYKDKVRATVIGDKVYYPKESDIKRITEAFENELMELGKEVGIDQVFVQE